MYLFAGGVWCRSAGQTLPRNRPCLYNPLHTRRSSKYVARQIFFPPFSLSGLGWVSTLGVVWTFSSPTKPIQEGEDIPPKRGKTVKSGDVMPRKSSALVCIQHFSSLVVYVIVCAHTLDALISEHLHSREKKKKRSKADTERPHAQRAPFGSLQEIGII